MALFPAGWDYLSVSPRPAWRARCTRWDGLAKPGLVTTLVKMRKVIPSSRLLRAVGLALLVLASVTVCDSGALTQGPKLAKDQTLRVQLEDQPGSLDPGQTQYPYET